MEENNLELKDIANELIIINKETIDKLFKLDNCVDCLALYIFYYKTAKWQKTNQIKASDNYVMKSLGFGKTKLVNAKKSLKENGLVEIVKKVDKSNKIQGWFIKINYIVKEQTISKIKPTIIKENDEKPEVLKPEVLKTTSGFQDTNALRINNIYNNIYIKYKCLKKYKINATNEENLENDTFLEALNGFVEMRNQSSKKEKHITQHALDLILKKLEKLAPNNINAQIDILNQSIIKGWQDVYELKSDYNNSKPKREEIVYETI